MTEKQKDIYFSSDDLGPKTNFKIKILLILSHALTKFSPRTSAYVALNILCKPFGRRTYNLRTSVQPEMTSVKTSLGDVQLYKFKSEGADKNINVFLSHGWADSTTRFTQVIDHLIKNGFTVWSLDHIGHGKSFGKTSHLFAFIEGIKACLKHMDEQNASPKVLIGHSMGCLGLLNLEADVLKNKKLILVSAPTKFFENMYKKTSQVGVAPLMLTNLLDFVSKTHGMQWEELSPHLQTEKINENCLIVHDDTDFVCSFSNIKELTKDRPNKVFSTTGLGHLKILKSPEVLEQILSFSES